MNKTKLTKSIEHNYFSIENIKNYPERLIIVGFIAADGCISQPKTGQKLLIFNISIKDKHALDIINNELCGGLRNLSNIKKTESLMLTIPSNKICDDLKRFNIVERKTDIYDLPNLNIKEMSYFLRGYFYGDGCISDSYNSGCFLIGSNCFSKSLQKYLINNKILDDCRIYKIKGRNNCMQIRFTGRIASKFSHFIFKDEKLMLIPKKHKILKEKILNSKWTNEEKELLFKLDINEFCKTTGRSKNTALTYLKYPNRIGLWKSNII